MKNDSLKIHHLNEDKNDRSNALSTCAEKRLQLRWKHDDVKKIWLNNLNGLSRDFFFVERAEGYLGGRCSLDHASTSILLCSQWTRAVSD